MTEAFTALGYATLNNNIIYPNKYNHVSDGNPAEAITLKYLCVQCSFAFVGSFLTTSEIMKIQWFPGHMHKASKEIREKLPEMDLLIEVLDARLPGSSENPMIASIRQNKPCIKIFNKSDLADPELTEKWQNYYEQDKGIKTLTITREQPEKIKQISSLCRKMIYLVHLRMPRSKAS